MAEEGGAAASPCRSHGTGQEAPCHGPRLHRFAIPPLSALFDFPRLLMCAGCEFWYIISGVVDLEL